jgi:hypothetical protein
VVSTIQNRGREGERGLNRNNNNHHHHQYSSPVPQHAAGIGSGGIATGNQHGVLAIDRMLPECMQPVATSGQRRGEERRFESK